jgi:hypothetical protein
MLHFFVFSSGRPSSARGACLACAVDVFIKLLALGYVTVVTHVVEQLSFALLLHPCPWGAHTRAVQKIATLAFAGVQNCRQTLAFVRLKGERP